MPPKRKASGPAEEKKSANTTSSLALALREIPNKTVELRRAAAQAIITSDSMALALKKEAPPERVLTTILMALTTHVATLIATPENHVEVSINSQEIAAVLTDLISTLSSMADAIADLFKESQRDEEKYALINDLFNDHQNPFMAFFKLLKHLIKAITNQDQLSSILQLLEKFATTLSPSFKDDALDDLFKLYTDTAIILFQHSPQAAWSTTFKTIFPDSFYLPSDDGGHVKLPVTILDSDDDYIQPQGYHYIVLAQIEAIEFIIKHFIANWKVIPGATLEESGALTLAKQMLSCLHQYMFLPYLTLSDGSGEALNTAITSCLDAITAASTETPWEQLIREHICSFLYLPNNLQILREPPTPDDTVNNYLEKYRVPAAQTTATTQRLFDSPANTAAAEPPARGWGCPIS